jgi:predicted ATPase
MPHEYALSQIKEGIENGPLGLYFNNIEKPEEKIEKTIVSKAEGHDNDEGRFAAGHGVKYYSRSQKLPDASSMLADFFKKDIHYLGPLRVGPNELVDEKYYNETVGVRGEFHALFFSEMKNKDVNYIPPEYFDDTKSPDEIIKKTTSLEKAVKQWLSYLGIANSLEIIDNAEYGHRLVVNNDDEHNVGTGLSQVLPILIMCLAADEGSLCIIEQPELHLHPMPQSRLADFFLSMTMLGKQCIVETHSEYLIDCLRLRLVEAEKAQDKKVMNAIKIYFAKRDDGNSVFTPINPDESWDWPEDFMDVRQKLADKILGAATSDIDFSQFGTENDD